MNIIGSKTRKGKTIYPPHYFRWRAMMYRCYNPNSTEFCRYGARGIFVCDEWKIFNVFQRWCIQTAEKGKTIDRIDNDGPYQPNNCRWATPAEQQNTARKTVAKIKAIKYATQFRRPTVEYRRRNAKGQFI